VAVRLGGATLGWGGHFGSWLLILGNSTTSHNSETHTYPSSSSSHQHSQSLNPDTPISPGLFTLPVPSFRFQSSRSNVPPTFSHCLSSALGRGRHLFLSFESSFYSLIIEAMHAHCRTLGKQVRVQKSTHIPLLSKTTGNPILSLPVLFPGAHVPMCVHIEISPS
jgi:hypothetical protein